MKPPLRGGALTGGALSGGTLSGGAFSGGALSEGALIVAGWDFSFIGATREVECYPVCMILVHEGMCLMLALILVLLM